VRYTELTALLTKAIQEQQARLDALTGNLAAAGLSTGQKLSINAAGRVEVKELATERLCLGGTCITEVDLRKLLNLDPNLPVDNSSGGAITVVPDSLITPPDESAKFELEPKSTAAELPVAKAEALVVPEAPTLENPTK
jgi:hypothetical protein